MKRVVAIAFVSAAHWACESDESLRPLAVDTAPADASRSTSDADLPVEAAADALDSGVPDATGVVDGNAGLPACGDMPDTDADASFWSHAYVACEPTSESGAPPHHRGNDCMVCHGLGSMGPERWAFAGTVAVPSGTPWTGAEIGVRTQDRMLFARAYSNGTFYAPLGDAGADAAIIEVRVRTERGESIMRSQAHGACSACHTDSLPIGIP